MAVLLVLTACTSPVAGVAERPPAVASAHPSIPPPRTTAPGPPAARTAAPDTPASDTAAPDTAAPDTGAPSTATGRPSKRSVASTPTSPSAPPRVGLAPMPTQVDVTELFDALTVDLRQHDRTGFLSRFRGKAAGAAARWWTNLDAIGFDGGAVGSYRGQEDVIALDQSGRGTVEYVTAGAHHAGDQVESTGAQDVPTTLYRWQLTYDRRQRRVEVTRWTALSTAPWDCGCTLYVARDGTAVVAAEPAEAALADSEVDDLVAALRWSATFDHSVAPDWPVLTTAVAFTTDHPDRMAAWFRLPVSEGGTGHDPYWEDPPPAYTHYLLGDTGSAAHVAHDSYIGGARIVLGPEAVDGATETLVHELVHYRLATERADSGYATKNPWIAEGVAQLIQQIYVDTAGRRGCRRRLGGGRPGGRLRDLAGAGGRGVPRSAADRGPGVRRRSGGSDLLVPDLGVGV